MDEHSRLHVTRGSRIPGFEIVEVLRELRFEQPYQGNLEGARAKCFEELNDTALAIGADGLIGLNMSTVARDDGGFSLVVVATAVRLRQTW